MNLACTVCWSEICTVCSPKPCIYCFYCCSSAVVFPLRTSVTKFILSLCTQTRICPILGFCWLYRSRMEGYRLTNFLFCCPTNIFMGRAENKLFHLSFAYLKFRKSNEACTLNNVSSSTFWNAKIIAVIIKRSVKKTHFHALSSSDISLR